MTDLLAAAAAVQAAASPPTTETGTAITTGFRPMTPGPLSIGWDYLVADSETVPELRWAPYGRGSVGVFSKMATDPQVQGLYWGMTLPIRRYKWFVEPNGASDRTVTEFAQDMGLQVKDVPRETVGRTRGRFNHDDHLRHALLALRWGHMFFEQVGDITVNPLRWRLRKLSPRMPQSLEAIMVAPDGGLAGIVQRGNPTPLEIPVTQLAAYVWDREGSNWVGRSMLRAMYGPWLIKQRLVRIDVIKHERNGMGIPLSRQTIPDDNPQAMKRAQALAEQIRAGEVAGATLPYGFDLDLKGVTGSLPDTMASIRYCDEAMARAVLMMFMMLGQTQTGSRALGSEFIDYISLNQAVIADWYADTTSEHVAEDYTDWNDGETAQAPRIGYDRDEHPDLAVADLIAAIDADVVRVSPEDEAAFRERYNLPPEGTPRPLRATPGSAKATAPGGPDPALPAERAIPIAAAAAPDGTPAAAATTDFTDLQRVHDAAQAELEALWNRVRGEQTNQLTGQVAKATTVAALASLTVKPQGAEDLIGVLEDVLEHGAGSAMAEAARQGVDLPDPALAAALTDIHQAATAAATVLAASLAQSATTKALSVAGPNLMGEPLAGLVRDHLESLAGADASYQITGLITRAQNQGRFAAMAGGAPDTTYYSSELNDVNTCQPCELEDGTSYDSLDHALADYPAGGYVGCEGGMRCRGTLVAVYIGQEADVNAAFMSRQHVHGGGKFKSERQRRYLWAAHPRAARKWAHNLKTSKPDWAGSPSVKRETHRRRT